jgi:hypothetical protein
MSTQGVRFRAEGIRADVAVPPTHNPSLTFGNTAVRQPDPAV